MTAAASWPGRNAVNGWNDVLALLLGGTALGATLKAIVDQYGRYRVKHLDIKLEESREAAANRLAIDVTARQLRDEMQELIDRQDARIKLLETEVDRIRGLYHETMEQRESLKLLSISQAARIELLTEETHRLTSERDRAYAEVVALRTSMGDRRGHQR
jgi:hypothetical protein